MFLNKLYKVINLESAPDRMVAHLIISPEHEIFKGHFPGSPVLPGVIQIQIVKELLENQLGMFLRTNTMRSCKFLQIINPEVTPEIVFDVKFARGEFLNVVASASDPANVYLKLQMSFRVLVA